MDGDAHQDFSSCRFVASVFPLLLLKAPCEDNSMLRNNSLFIEISFITIVFGYLAFQLLRTYLIHLAEHHPSVKRILGKLHINTAD